MGQEEGFNFRLRGPGETAVLGADYGPAAAQHLSWTQRHALQGRSCSTEGHIPQSCLAIVGGFLRSLQGSAGLEPSPSDYVFIVPKVLWPKPLGKVRWKTKVKKVNERLVLAQQGKWSTLFDLSMQMQLPTYGPILEDEIMDEHGLSKETAHKLHAAAC